MDILNFFNENFWAVATIISLLTIPVTSAINAKFNLKTIWKQVIAWATSIVLTVVAYFGGIATFNEPVWLTIPLTGLVCGLSITYSKPNFLNAFAFPWVVGIR